MAKRIRIGITDCGKYSRYEQWMIAAPEGVEVFRLSSRRDNWGILDFCDGVVLSGGEDVHPARYGKPEYLPQLDPKEINERRDAFEFKVLERLMQLNKPVLGICRGSQIMNVFLGGSLYADIETATGIKGHPKSGGADTRHPVTISEGSLLAGIAQGTHGEINSAHHQAVDRLAPSLVVTATAEGGIVEATEWKEPEGKPWMLLVQWHPERMTDQENPLAAGLRSAFLSNFR